MQPRNALIVLLVVGLALPIAGASAIPAPSFDQSSAGGATTATAAGASSSSASSAPDAANYTRLYVADGYRHLQLKPGESDSLTVTVESGEDEPVEIDPHLVVPKVGDRPLPDSWVSVDAGETTVGPDEEVEVTVSVEVPEDAELGRYRAWVALTNETITYPGRPPRPVHAATVSVEVWREPTLRLVSGHRLYTQVEAGESYTHRIVVRNDGDEAVPLSPEVASDRRGRCHGDCPGTIDRSWMEIDAPNEVPAGGTATVNVTVTSPADAERGRYDTELDLGLKDPARSERNTYWQRVDLTVQVWKQPDEPFETTFEVSEETDEITLTLSAGVPHYRGSDEHEPADFDVVFVAPDGATVDGERVRVIDQGYVDLTGRDREPGEEYATGGGSQRFVYRVDDPLSGTWTARITPENVVRFRYEIARNESAG